MGRVVRSLLKLPAVKRVMLRLANAEAAITRQQAQLVELGGLAQRLSADEANHRALLAEVAEHMPPARLAEVEADDPESTSRTRTLNEASDWSRRSVTGLVGIGTHAAARLGSWRRR